MGETRTKPEELCLRLVEGQHQEWPVEHDRGDTYHEGEDRQHHEIAGGDTEGVTEEDRRDVPDIRGRTRGEDHAEAKHAHKEQADARVLGEGRLPMDEVDPDQHQRGGTEGTEHHVEVEQRERDRGERAADQRPLLEGKRERIEEPVHAMTLPVRSQVLSHRVLQRPVRRS